MHDEVSDTENIRKNLAIERMIVEGCDILLDTSQTFVRQGMYGEKTYLSVCDERAKATFNFVSLPCKNMVLQTAFYIENMSYSHVYCFERQQQIDEFHFKHTAQQVRMIFLIKWYQTV